MTETKPPLLIVDDDETIRRSAEQLLCRAGYEVMTAEDGIEGLERLHDREPTIMLVDLRMPRMGGMELIDRALAAAPDVAIVVMTAHGSIESAVKAMRLGAIDFVTKPFDREGLLATIDKARLYHSLLRENRWLRRQVDHRVGFEDVIAASEAMRAVIEQARMIAATPSNILLLGESGTGKELLARTIHKHSRMAEGPFHAINLGAIPEGLFESELFGHRRGAFTGAIETRRGALAAAAEGTLFLDEVGELPPSAQVKLLRVLQEREYQRVGEDRSRPVKVRFIAATNQDLEARVRSGEFREDLYYRLCVVPIRLPPLRQRREDVPAFATRFLEEAGERLARPVPILSRTALDALCQYDFPGNVRELENLMERAVAVNRGEPISVAELGLAPKSVNLAALVFDRKPGGLDLQDLERDLIREALLRSGSNQTRAAELLGISRSALIYRMDKYKLRSETDAESRG